MLRFSAPHHFSIGDAVIYRIATGGTSISSDFVDGQVLYVRPVDNYTIELYTTLAAATAAALTFHTGDVSGNQIATSTFSTGDRVTYRSDPTRAFTYSTSSDTSKPYLTHSVDVNVDGGGNVTGDNSGAYNIYLATATFTSPGQSATISGHGLNDGEAVVYQTSDAGNKIPELTVGTTYYVIYQSAFTIQLALTYCDAVGHVGDSACPVSATVTPIHISAPSESHAVQAIAPLGIGLVDGNTYTVTRADSGHISLNGQTLSTAHVFGNQQLYLAGSPLTAGGGGQQLYLKLTGSLPSSDQRLLATDQTSLRLASPPLGAGVTVASAHGGGGGAFSFTEQDATTSINPTVLAYDDATSIVAGFNVGITAQVVTNGGASTSNGSGGFISGAGVSSTLGGTNITSAFIGTGPAAGITGDSASPQVTATGVSITAGGMVRVASTSTLEAHVNGNTESGGFAGGSVSSAEINLTDKTSSVIGDGATVTASTLSVLASTVNSNLTSHSRSIFIAFAGFATAEADSHLTSYDTALIDGQASTTTAVFL